MASEISRRGLRRLLLVPLLLLCLFALAPRARAAQEQGREIAVVYDDSGSMVYNQGSYQSNWCRAKYAMEVFAAMLKTSDRMTVYPMSYYRDGTSATAVTISGSQSSKDRVSTIHNMEHASRGTYFNSVKAAAAALRGAGDSRTKWLVVLTDGEFDNVSDEEVQSFVNGCADDNIRVVYFVMSSGDPSVKAVDADTSKGIYSYKADTSDETLSGIITCANQVFNQRELDAANISQQSGSVQLQLPVPVSEVIVFAQGEDVTVGSLTGPDGGTWTATEKTSVKYSDKKPADCGTSGFDASKVVTDTSLKGVLAVYKPDSALADGTYSVKVENASSVNVYYTPAVEVALLLTDKDGTTYNLSSSTATLYSGTYQVQAQLINPITGDKLDSGLVDLQDCTAVITNNGETITLENLDRTASELLLDAGTYSGRVTALLTGQDDAVTEFSGEVSPAPWKGTVTFDPWSSEGKKAAAYSFGLDHLEDGSGVLITVYEVNPETGEKSLMSEDVWGSIPVSAQESAEAQSEGVQTTAGIRYTAEALSADSGAGGFKGLLYKAYDFFCARGKAEDGSKGRQTKWTLSKGSDVSTFLLTPQYNTDADHTFYGTVKLTFSCYAESPNHTCLSSGDVTVSIDPMGFDEIVKALIPFAIGGLLLLLGLLLFIRAPRLPKNLAATIYADFRVGGGFADDNDAPRELNLKKHFTLFTAQTGTLSTSKTGIFNGQQLKLKACGSGLFGNSSRRFYITNIEEFARNQESAYGSSPGFFPVSLNSKDIKPGSNRQKVSANARISCMANQTGLASPPPCEIKFIIKRKKGVIAELLGGKRGRRGGRGRRRRR